MLYRGLIMSGCEPEAVDPEIMGKSLEKITIITQTRTKTNFAVVNVQRLTTK